MTNLDRARAAYKAHRFHRRFARSPCDAIMAGLLYVAWRVYLDRAVMEVGP